MRRREAKV